MEPAGTGAGAQGGSAASAAGGGGAETAGGAAEGGSTTNGGCASATDCPASETLCRLPVCADGACNTSLAVEGTACDDGGGRVCDGAGHCVECQAGQDCPDYPNTICSNHQCVGATCTDGQKNGAEIGVDCGGGLCPGCADGFVCNQGPDCASGACLSGHCAPCGGADQPCCQGSCDAAPLTCVQNTSTAWGGTDHECNCGLLRAGQELLTGDQRYSCDGRFLLVMQGDGNLVLYWVGQLALWSSNTTGTGANRAVLLDDGNFVVLDTSGTPYWSSGTSGLTGAFVGVQNDGNLVVYDGGSTPYWASNTCCY